MSYVKENRRWDMWGGLPYQIDVCDEKGSVTQKIGRVSSQGYALLIWRQACVEHPDKRVLMCHRARVERDSGRG